MKTFALVLMLWISIPFAAYGQSAPVEMILLNGRVFTADPARPLAEAIAIRGERIAAVGTSAEIARLAGPQTRRIDVQGRLIMPGFNDAHASSWFGSAADWPAMVFRVEVVCAWRHFNSRYPTSSWGNWRSRKDVDAGKIEQLKNLLADTKSLSTPDQNQQINDLVA